jgi:hypothetical protein
MIDPKKVRLLRVAVTRLALSEDDFRAILRHVGHVESTRDLNDDGFSRVMEHFARLGFQSFSRQRNFGDRPGMASAGQVQKMRALWAEYTAGAGTDATLGKWLEHTFKVAALRFVPAESAPKIITALKVMVGKRAHVPVAGSPAA